MSQTEFNIVYMCERRGYEVRANYVPEYLIVRDSAGDPYFQPLPGGPRNRVVSIEAVREEAAEAARAYFDRFGSASE